MSKENYNGDNKISLYNQLITFVDQIVKGDIKNIIWSCEQYREAKKTIDKHKAFFNLEDYADQLESKLILLCNGTKDQDYIKEQRLPKEVVDYQYIERRVKGNENNS